MSFTGYLQFTPDCGALDFESTMITPFWADIDIRNEGAIYYRETSDPVLLEKAAGEIQKTFPNPKDLFLSFMFVTTFDRVTFYRACTSNITNTFQAIFTSDGTRSFTIFNYNDITWTTGPDSGGDCSTGLGGSPAKTGFDVGDGITFFEIPGSCSDEIIELEETTNVNEPGKWIFRVDNSLESPEIEPILTCSPILPLENGYFEVDNFTVGSYAVFYCNEPFILVGESSITCTDEAVWSADAPVCTAATAEFTCTDPPGTSSYHKDVEDCTKYYVCEGTRKHHMPCPAPLVFNPQWNVCDWKANVEGC